jgi:hypothetical protein
MAQPVPVTPVTDFEVGKNPCFQANVLNVGQTPAYAFTFDCWMEVVQSSETDFPANSRVASDTSGQTIYPNSPQATPNIAIRTDHPLSQLDLDEWRSGRREVWMRIRVGYRDLFRKRWYRRKRFADFGWRYTNGGLKIIPKYQNSN